MDKEKAKKILIKASDLEQGKEIGLAKEFINLDDKIESLQEKADFLVEEADNKVPTVITEDSVILEYPEYPEFPTEIEVSNFPDVQKVEVTNYPEVKAPIVNVEAPQVNVESPVINLDTELIEKELKTSNETLKEISEKLNKEELEEQEGAISKVTLVDKDGKEVRWGGGGGGIAKYQYDALGNTINPATEEKQDAIITALGNVKIDTGDIDLNTDGLEGKLDTQIVNETTMISLIETLNELNARLQVLAGMANSGQPALRVMPLVSPNMNVLSTVTNLTNFGTGYPAKEMADDINNYTAVVSNINNVTT